MAAAVSSPVLGPMPRLALRAALKAVLERRRSRRGIDAAGARVRTRRAGPVTGAEVPALGQVAGARAGAVWRERTGLAVRERMPLWLQSRCGLERQECGRAHGGARGRRGLRRAALLGGADAAGAGTRSGAGRGSVRGRAARAGRRRRGSSAAARDPWAWPDAAGAAAGAVIVVDVSGKVREPGYPAVAGRFPGRRCAAGRRRGAARHEHRGTQPGAAPRGRRAGGGRRPSGPWRARCGGRSGCRGLRRSRRGAAAAAPVPLNTATVEQLDTLPGVGPVLAQHIIDYRTQHGGFRSVDELREVNGIGDRRFADLQNLVRP